MRKRNNYILLILPLLALMSCAVGKKLPPGTQLYKGAQYEIVKEEGNKTSAKSIKKQLKKITAPVPNKTILGFPYRVWLWYLVGEPKKQKGLKYWLRNKLGEPPVLSTAVDVKANSSNFQNSLQNKGYFKSYASGDTTVKGYRVTAKYKISLGMPYKINQVKWIFDSTKEITGDIKKMDNKENYVKNNEQFDLDNIKAERTRTDLFLKTIGYYYFSPDYIKAWIDSTNSNNTVDVYMRLKDDAPKAAILPQTIENIVLFPNYTLLRPPPDTSRKNMFMVDSIFIRDTIKQIKGTALVRSVTYRPGALYNIKDQNKTLNRFINMGLFKFVKNRYEGSRDSLDPRFLDVYYYLTPMKKKTINAEIGGFTKSNSFTGGQFNVTWKNRNTFGGAEQLMIKGYTALETSRTDSLRNNNNYRLGGEVSLVFPRFITPFFSIKESNYFPPKTRFTLSYEWLRRQNLFTKNFFRFQYDLTWKEALNKEHTLSPLTISYNNTSNATPEYLAQLAQLPVLSLSNLPEVILGSFYNFTFNSINPNAKDVFYLSTNVELAGNITGLISKPSLPFSTKLLGAYYSQYAKLDVDFHYSRKLGDETYLANRFSFGIGQPYGNSAFLPFSRQFIIGGANDMRGFSPRQLGPGRVQTTPAQQIYLPQVGGDYKLLLNSELRFPLMGRIKGALFLDAGNIWTKDTLIYGKGGQLTKSFLKDLGVDAGFGVRVDISVLVIRFDIAAPLRKPWLPRGQEWVIKDFQPFNRDWRRDNVVFNIGIGYPF